MQFTDYKAGIGHCEEWRDSFMHTLRQEDRAEE